MVKKVSLVLTSLFICFTLYAGIKFLTARTETVSQDTSASQMRRLTQTSLLTSEPVEYSDKKLIAMMDSMIKSAGPVPKYRMQMADITTQRVSQEHKACAKLHLSREETLKRVTAVSNGGQRETERVEASHFTVPFNVKFPPVYEDNKK